MEHRGADVAAETAFTSILPSAARADAVDRNLRVRLAASLDYLSAFAGGDVAGVLRSLSDKLPSTPVSPWLFCLYSRLVADLSQRRPLSPDVAQALSDAGDLPARTDPVALHDPSIPDDWWEHYLVLLDTDPDRNFRPAAPTAEAAKRRRGEIAEALQLLAECDAEMHDEVRSLLHMPILAAPATSNRRDRFNGASTFFMWGAALINARTSTGPIATIDILVHESSHLLLFGLVEGKALTQNDASERYASPLRPDQRPIDGIFHACFVAARVYAAMSRLLDGGRLSAADSEAAERRRDYNGNAAQTGLASLSEYARPTERGERILSVLRSYVAGLV
jgi:hypothetical protein